MEHWSAFEGEVKQRVHPKGTVCSVGALLDSLHDEARGIVEATLSNPRLPATAIHRALRARVGDDAPSAWSVGNHRRGYCRCGR